MSRLFILGLGYTARALAAHLAERGWRVSGTSRDGLPGTVAFHDAPAVGAEIAAATHILSSVPPEGADPVLAAHGPALARSPAWLGYLSSTGVYGDANGAWVDETSPLRGRRPARIAADRDWLALGARVFRLPGIYGPGRSALDRVAAGRAHRVDLPDQVFSRVHVDDIVSGVVAAFDAPPAAYNLSDDHPASQDDVAVFAARLLGLAPPPFVALDALSPMSRDFYAENRRVSPARAHRVLGWRPRYPDFRVGLRALSAMTSPTPVRPAPSPANVVQR